MFQQASSTDGEVLLRIDMIREFVRGCRRESMARVNKQIDFFGKGEEKMK